MATNMQSKEIIEASNKLINVRQWSKFLMTQHKHLIKSNYFNTLYKNVR